MTIKDKILKLGALKRIVSHLKKQGKTIAFTNGCFDLLHIGHTSYLTAAKKNNRILIVGLNSDASVRKIKGLSRPIVNQNDRAGVLAALASVDYVVIFDEENPYRVIQTLKPDILIKGADWKQKGVIGSDIVKSRGGKVEFVHYRKGYSTKNLIQTILKKCKSKK